VGECAGVMVDLVDTLIFESEEKINWAENAFNENLFADSIYHSYAAIIGIAKVLLIEKDIFTNTHIGIINDFEKHFVITSEIAIEGTFKDFVLQINQNEPSKAFASKYLIDAKQFLVKGNRMREKKKDQD
jgi:sulfite reductase (ferredoxin)